MYPGNAYLRIQQNQLWFPGHRQETCCVGIFFDPGGFVKILCDQSRLFLWSDQWYRLLCHHGKKALCGYMGFERLFWSLFMISSDTVSSTGWGAHSPWISNVSHYEWLRILKYDARRFLILQLMNQIDDIGFWYWFILVDTLALYFMSQFS